MAVREQTSRKDRSDKSLEAVKSFRGRVNFNSRPVENFPFFDKPYILLIFKAERVLVKRSNTNTILCCMAYDTPFAAGIHTVPRQCCPVCVELDYMQIVELRKAGP